MPEPVQAEVHEVSNENGAFTYVKLPERPESIPEKFWHPEHGLNLTGLNNGYTKLESTRAQYQDEIKRNLEQEFNQKLPKAPEQYQVNPPKLEDAPESFTFDAEADPVVSTLMKAGKDASLPQDAFDKIVEARATDALAEFKQLGQRTREVLGDSYAERINRVSGKLKELLGDDGMAAIASAVSEPAAVVALEKLVGGNAAPGPGGGTHSPALTEQDLRTMMRDPRYSDPYQRDPAYVKKIEDGFKQLYGEQQVDGNQRFTMGG